MNRRVLHAIQLFVLIVTASVLACSFEASFSASVSFRISTDARVLSSEATQQAEVAPSEVAMPVASLQNLEIKPGVILVSEDFVRKVVSTETVDGKLVAKTEPSSLDQVIEKGEYATVYDLGADPAVAEKWATARPKATWTGKGFDVVLDRRSILLDDATTDARVWLDGSLAFRPSIDLRLQFGPTYAHAIARGTLDAKLNVTASAAVKKAYTKSVLLWESPPFAMPLGWIGPVPIKFEAKLAVRALLTVTATGKVIVSTGFVFHGAGGYGFRYQDGSLGSVNEWSAGGEVTPLSVTATGDLDIYAALRAEIDGGINGDVWLASATGGMRLSAEMYAAAHVDPKTWMANVGARADARAYLSVVALFWSREWETDPVNIMNKTLMSWPSTGAASTATKACSSTSPITCGASFDPSCAPCKNEERCVVSSDCASSFCFGGYCFPSTIYSKGAGQDCANDWDCQVGLSCITEIQPDRLLKKTCRPDHCGDERKDADESDRDCGGGCRPCLNGFACGAKSDCASGICRTGFCARY